MPEPSARRAAVVEYQHVSKRYASASPTRDSPAAPPAVYDLSLTVPAGKICVLVGPSGCGKTTSLKMVNRLIEPTGGRILIDGADVAGRDATELRREIGYVIQQVGLFPHQTIGENVAVVPRLLGWPAARQRDAGGGAARACRAWIRRSTATVTRPSSPAGNGSGSASPAPWPPTRR